ncbi:MAG: NlpC/P60 family protein [Candidatus Zixiibacteriota bacterium]
MKFAFVTTNLTDLWAEPRYNSERASQLLFGEIVRLGPVKNGYVKVFQTDEYTGWVDQRFLRPISRSASRLYNTEARHVVVRDRVKVMAEAGRPSAAPYLLFYGTRIMVRSAARGLAACRRPDGTEFKCRRSGLALVDNNSVRPPLGTAVVAEARRFVGVPYLWGGITTVGFDCSGLVRTVLGRFGVYVPRDTKDQIKIGRPVDREQVRTGDLLFFKRHVGFAMGRNHIVHSSVGGSGVRVNSLTPGSDDYRPDLDRDFAAARRIL